MSEIKTYQVPDAIAQKAHINASQYHELYRRSIEDSDIFWAEQADKFLSWFRKWNKVQEWTYENDVRINWFVGGKLNVSYNCLDRHLQKRGEQVAIIWEGDDPDDYRKITYRELHPGV
jgi:acetyl-CoA synthetase